MKESSRWQVLFALTIIAAASLMHLYPLLGSFASAIPYAHIGDVNLTIAILYANLNHVLSGQWLQLYHLPFLFPYSYALTMGFTMFGHTLLLLPASPFGIGNISVVYNLLVFFAYIMSGMGAYLLIREMTGRHMISIMTACLYVLLPFRVGNIPHLNLLFHFSIPFCFLFLYRYLKLGRARSLIALNGFLLLQFLFDLSLGFYLVVALSVFYLFSLAVLPVTLRKTGLLAASLAATMGILILIHLPFLRKELSLSSATGEFAAGQYNPALTFYTGKSYFLNLFHHNWNPLAFSLGITASLLFLAAFTSYLQKRWERYLLAITTIAAILPIILLITLKNAGRSHAITLATDIPLTLFISSLALLLVVLRKRIPPALFISAVTYMTMICVSFYPFPRLVDPFGLLARVLPFLSRSRGAIRTHYIFPLLAIIVIAFGIDAFLSRKKKPALTFAILTICLAAEFMRWPVQISRPSDPGPDGRSMYRMIRDYPGQSGLLELPFLPIAGNAYPQFTRFHDKHTYHGHYYFFRDPLQLEKTPELSIEQAFPGLKTKAFTQFLCRHRLRLILINRSFIDGQEKWRTIRETVRAGEEAELYEKVVRSRQAILLVLRDRLEGKRIEVEIPYYFFVGKRTLSFRLDGDATAPGRLIFNGFLLTPTAGGNSASETVRLPVASLPLNHQQNRLTATADRDLVLENIRLD